MAAPETPIAQAPTLEALTVGTSATIEVPLTEADIDRFAALSGDHAPVHTAAAFARAQGFAGRVVHGAHLVALVSQVIGMSLPGAYGVLLSVSLEFRRPVCVPATVHVTVELASRSEATGVLGLRLTCAVDGAVCAAGQARSVWRGPAAPEVHA